MKLKLFFILVLAVPIVLLVHSIRPIKLIRFGSLRSNRVGQFAINTELYLSAREIGLGKRNTLDLFWCPEPISNYQLKKMWGRCLKIYRFVKYLDRINRMIPWGTTHSVTMPEGYKFIARDTDGLLTLTKPHISFTKQETLKGIDSIKRIGIEGDSPYVCFLGRDSTYLNTIEPNKDWDYHSYRDFDINDILEAAEYLSLKKMFSIRMGSITKKPLISNNPMIIDYATNYRTDFLDIFLTANCKFFVSCGTGIDTVADIFRRPVAHINFLPLEGIHSWYQNGLTIPKKIWSSKESRLLTFKEIIESGVGRFLQTKQYNEFGLKIIDNTPTEIAELVCEMEQRLTGVWVPDQDDEELQQCFWSLFQKSELHGTIKARIGTSYLRDNIDLLS